MAASQELPEEMFVFGVAKGGDSSEMYVAQEDVTGCLAGFYALHEGERHYREREQVTFIKFVNLDRKKKRALKELGTSEALLSDAACFPHVVRYKDYISNSDDIDVNDPNKRLVNHEKIQDSLVTERTAWQGLDPRRGGPAMSDEAILEVAYDMLRALAYLHGRGVVHGDVRLRNILPVRPAFESSSSGSKERDVSYKLIGHGLVPDVIDHFACPPLASVAPELRRLRRSSQGPYKPTTRSDVWMLGLALRELHDAAAAAAARGRPGGGLSRSRSTVFAEKETAGGFEGLEERGGGECKRLHHTALDKLLKEMLDTNPRKRPTAMNALVSMAEMKAAASDLDWVTWETRPVELAVENARRESRRRRWGLVGRMWERLQKVVFSALVLIFTIILRIF